MTVKIVLHQVRTSDPDGYKIENTILDGVGQTEDIDPNLFVFRYVDGTNDSYQHVVTADDLDNYPAQGETGWNTFGALYRSKIANLVYSAVTAADEQALLMQERLQELATEYDEDVADWDGIDVYDYQSDTGNVKIQLTQTKTQETGDVYRVNSAITSVLAITDHLFLVDKDTAEYVRVATVYDIQMYPAAPGAEDYYRANVFTKDFNTLEEAEIHDFTMQTSLDALTEAYDTYIADFEGDETLTYNP